MLPDKEFLIFETLKITLLISLLLRNTTEQTLSYFIGVKGE